MDSGDDTGDEIGAFVAAGIGNQPLFPWDDSGVGELPEVGVDGVSSGVSMAVSGDSVGVDVASVVSTVGAETGAATGATTGAFVPAGKTVILSETEVGAGSVGVDTIGAGSVGAVTVGADSGVLEVSVGHKV